MTDTVMQTTKMIGKTIAELIHDIGVMAEEHGNIKAVRSIERLRGALLPDFSYRTGNSGEEPIMLDLDRFDLYAVIGKLINREIHEETVYPLMVASVEADDRELAEQAFLLQRVIFALEEETRALRKKNPGSFFRELPDRAFVRQP